eukprot:jgi/Chrzof1/1926/Cz10g26160.t1
MTGHHHVHALFLLGLVVIGVLAAEPAVAQGPPENTTDESYYKDLDPCVIGPSYWCISQNKMDNCGVANTVVGVCGYSSRDCPEQTVAEFCRTHPSAKKFNGGLNGSPDGYSAVYVNALYWAPSSCQANVSSGGFCAYLATQKGNYAATHLVLHGLWPDYGSLYTPAQGFPNGPPQPPFYNGSYQVGCSCSMVARLQQGLAQWCNSPSLNASQCAVNGGLCSDPNAFNMTQNQYQQCLRRENRTQCLVPQSVVDALGQNLTTIAPGFVDGGDGTPITPSQMLDHEFFKHGTCAGPQISANMTAYLRIATDLAINDTKSGSVADQCIHQKIGQNVSYAGLRDALADMAALQCTADCKLNEVWYCYGRDRAGLPTGLVRCPIGTLGSASCLTRGCTNISIPSY